MNTFNPLPLLVFALAVVGALSDWRYKRKGGQKPSRPTRIIFRVVLSLMVALFVIVLVLAATHPATAEDIAENGTGAIVRPSVLLFGAWEFSRWMVRTKHPLPKPSTL